MGASHKSEKGEGGVGTILGAILGLFLLWMIFGGYVEKFFGVASNNSTTHIDCRKADWANSPYCNGEYDQEGAMQDRYYQNIGH